MTAPDPPENSTTPSPHFDEIRLVDQTTSSADVDAAIPSRRLSTGTVDPPTLEQFPATPILRKELRTLDGRLLIVRPSKRETVDPPEFTGLLRLTDGPQKSLAEDVKERLLKLRQQQQAEENQLVPLDFHDKSNQLVVASAAPTNDDSRRSEKSSSSKRGGDQLTASTRSRGSSDVPSEEGQHDDNIESAALVPYEEADVEAPPSSRGSSVDAPEKSSSQRNHNHNVSSRALVRSNTKALVRTNSKVRKERRPSPVTETALVPATTAGGGALVVRRKSSSDKYMELQKGFDHCYVSVPRKERLSALFATLRRNSQRKIVVIFSSCESAKFHATLFRQLEMLPVHEMHESIAKDGTTPTTKAALSAAYDKFVYCYPGILFASDAALRDFDIPPNVDYVIQYEPPMIPTEYIYRMGNAETYVTSCHKALLFVAPDSSEMEFLHHFDDCGTVIHELQARRVEKFQEKVEKLILKHPELNELAWCAFRAFKKFYENHASQNVYDSKALEEEDGAVRKSFAMPYFPGYAPDVINEEVLKEDSKYLRKDSSSNNNNTNASNHHESSSSGHNKKYPWMEKSSSNEDEGRKDSSNPQAAWTRGKEMSWRKKGHNQNWMTKEKTWRHGHVHASN